MPATRPDSPTHGGGAGRGRALVLLAGPLLAAVPLWLPAPGAVDGEAWRFLGVLAWMVTWWVTEAVPVAVTALLPIPLLPLLGVMPQGEVAANYGNPLVFLFLGGFFVAGALRRWELHRRFALAVLLAVGARPRRLVGGVMLATAFLSMWISNTAAAILMYAVGLSLAQAVAERLPDRRTRHDFGLALMLGIAYSASIGGLGTLIGTPPNVLLAAYVSERFDLVLDFQRWLLVGLPITVVLLPFAWVWLTRVMHPLPAAPLAGARSFVRREWIALGPLTGPQRAVLAVFVVTAAAWILRPQLVALTGWEISDASIALLAAITLFALPASLQEGRFLLDWAAARSVSWDVLLLFGGGLALASAFDATGLAGALGALVAGWDGLAPWAAVAMVTATVMLLGELASNTASTATFLPVAGAVAVGLALPPLVATIPVALAASANFMMPVATPPNAIVFAHEDVTVPVMVRAGIVIEVVAFLLVLAAVGALGPVWARW